MSSFVQQAGRAARGHGRAGLAVLLVEKAVYEADLSQLVEEEPARVNSSKSKSKGVRQSTTYPKAPKGYSVQHGVLRGGHNGQSDEIQLKMGVTLDRASLDEGLYSLVQTGKCRREVLTAVYHNEKPRK